MQLTRILYLSTAICSSVLLGAIPTAHAEKAGSANDKVVATVNGEPITQPELDQYVSQLSQRGRQANRQQALQQLVAQELLAQEAKKQQLPEQSDIKAKLTNSERQVLASTLVNRHMEDNPVDEDQLRATYQQNRKQMEKTQYKTRHILVDEESKAKELIGQLDSGADFGELAKEHSTGPSGKKGGNLGWVQPDNLAPAFGKKLPEMEQGTYTAEPVKTQFGWHIIQLDDVRQKEAPKFDSVKGQIRQALKRQAVQQYLQKLQAEADVEIMDTASKGSDESQPSPKGQESAD